MQATRQTPPTAHVTRFGAALDLDDSAIADLTALAPAPDASDAVRVALWIGAAAGVMAPDILRAMQATGAEWRDAEALGMQALRKTAAGEGPLARQATRDLRRALAASRAGRLAAMASWAAHAAAPPGPGAMEANAAALLDQAAGIIGGAEAQMRLGRLVDAAEAAIARAAKAQAEDAQASAPHPLALGPARRDPGA